MKGVPWKSWFDHLMEKSFWVRWGVWLFLMLSFLSEPNKKLGVCRVMDSDCVGVHYFYFNLCTVIISFIALMYYEYRRHQNNQRWK